LEIRKENKMIPRKIRQIIAKRTELTEEKVKQVLKEVEEYLIASIVVNGRAKLIGVCSFNKGKKNKGRPNNRESHPYSLYSKTSSTLKKKIRKQESEK